MEPSHTLTLFNNLEALDPEETLSFWKSFSICLCCLCILVASSPPASSWSPLLLFSFSYPLTASFLKSYSWESFLHAHLFKKFEWTRNPTTSIQMTPNRCHQAPTRCPSSRCTFLIVWCPSPQRVAYCRLKFLKFKTRIIILVFTYEPFSVFPIFTKNSAIPLARAEIPESSLIPSSHLAGAQIPLILALWCVHPSRTCPPSPPIRPPSVSLAVAGVC